MIEDRKIGTWANPIVNEADRPNRSAADMKSIFDSNSNELKDAVNGVVDDIKAGDFQVAFTQAVSLANITADDSMSVILGKLAKFFASAQTAINTVEVDISHPNRFLSADGTYKVPAAGEAENGLPSGGATGDLLFKASGNDYDAEFRTATPDMIGAAFTPILGSGSLLADSWTPSGNGYTNTLSLPVLAGDNIIVCPAPSSFDSYTSAGCRGISVSDGLLTFYAKSIPDSDLSVNALILR